MIKDDPDSQVNQLLEKSEHFRMHEELGTEPGFYYIWDKKNMGTYDLSILKARDHCRDCKPPGICGQPVILLAAVPVQAYSLLLRCWRYLDFLFLANPAGLGLRGFWFVYGLA